MKRKSEIVDGEILGSPLKKHKSNFSATLQFWAGKQSSTEQQHVSLSPEAATNPWSGQKNIRTKTQFKNYEETKVHVGKEKEKIKEKYKKKIDWYKIKKKRREVEEMQESLPEECKEFGELRVLKGGKNHPWDS